MLRSAGRRPQRGEFLIDKNEFLVENTSNVQGETSLILLRTRFSFSFAPAARLDFTTIVTHISTCELTLESGSHSRAQSYVGQLSQRQTQSVTAWFHIR